jgi:L,D-peptidoglycan transpeptidase YkuD (ErfK/YbiS/YcfS/YnhG family)
MRAMTARDAWCDVAGDRNYNRLVRLPYPVIDERLWREDHLYDIVGVLSYNRLPRVQGAGSAIFIHGARPGYLPTAGCVALALPDLVKLLEHHPRLEAIAFG